jgi:hypothetical protein
MVAKEKIPGDCKHGPQKFPLDIIHHGIETRNQAISAAGASKKTEMGVRYQPQPTFCANLSFSQLGRVEVVYNTN